MSHNIAAVIVTHNNEQMVGACIDSLRANGVHDVVVVDNASSDSTVELVKNSSVELVKNEQNKGFGPAINQGVRTEARSPVKLRHGASKKPRKASPRGEQEARYLLFINPDAVLKPDSLSPAAEYMKNNPHIGVAGLLLCDQSGTPELHSFGKHINLWSLFARKFIKKLQPTPYPLQPQKVAWVSGGAMLVRREAFEQLKGFDEQFFMYWEDVDLCTRARRLGWQVVLIPSARVTHQRGASLTDKRRKADLYDQSADRYFRKHYATPIWLIHRYLRRIYRFFFPQAL